MTQDKKPERHALILMGCPQAPVQTSLVIYISHLLRKNGIKTAIAGNPAANQLINVADPEHYYTEKPSDIEKCIEEVAEKKISFSHAFALIHNDAGVSYAATIQALTGAEMYAVVFGKDAELIADRIEFLCTKIVDPSTHNPLKLKKKIDMVEIWAV